ncbi:MAG: DNA-3-methyladenine glycosylase family protein [Alphaproteobacteria bacterium]
MISRAVRPITPAGAIRRLKRGVKILTTADPALANIVETVGLPDIALRPTGFPTLLRAIIAQQVSAAAARTIWGRFEGATAGAVTAENVTALTYDGVRGLGLSGRKTDYALGLAEAERTGALDFDALEHLPDDEAITALTAIRGIGPWTAEVYLLFALGRPNIWPAADLALATAAGHMRGLTDRPSFKDAAVIAEDWQPWRGAAAILLWHYYRTMPA